MGCACSSKPRLDDSSAGPPLNPQARLRVATPESAPAGEKAVVSLSGGQQLKLEVLPDAVPVPKSTLSTSNVHIEKMDAQDALGSSLDIHPAPAVRGSREPPVMEEGQASKRGGQEELQRLAGTAPESSTLFNGLLPIADQERSRVPVSPVPVAGILKSTGVYSPEAREEQNKSPSLAASPNVSSRFGPSQPNSRTFLAHPPSHLSSHFSQTTSLDSPVDSAARRSTSVSPAIQPVRSRRLSVESSNAPIRRRSVEVNRPEDDPREYLGRRMSMAERDGTRSRKGSVRLVGSAGQDVEAARQAAIIEAAMNAAARLGVSDLDGTPGSTSLQRRSVRVVAENDPYGSMSRRSVNFSITPAADGARASPTAASDHQRRRSMSTSQGPAHDSPVVLEPRRRSISLGWEADGFLSPASSGGRRRSLHHSPRNEEPSPYMPPGASEAAAALAAQLGLVANGELEEPTAEEWDPFDDESDPGLTKMTHTLQLAVDEAGAKYVNEYKVIRKIGAGSYGKVKLVLNTEDNNHYAIKVFNKGTLRKKRTGRGCALDDVMREIAIMKRLCHRNVVRLYEVIDVPSEEKLYLVMEHLGGGVTMNASVFNEPLTEAVARRYMRDALLGLEYLHYKHVLHRDIKPENLLLGADGTLKISDFGVSYVFQDTDLVRKTAGSPAFMAPEACSAQQFAGRPADVWALGVTLYAWIFGVLPFLADSVFKIYQRITSEEPTLPRPVSAELQDLLSRLLQKEPRRRATLADMRVHPWITQHGADPVPASDFQEPPELSLDDPGPARLGDDSPGGLAATVGPGPNEPLSPAYSSPAASLRKLAPGSPSGSGRARTPLLDTAAILRSSSGKQNRKLATAASNGSRGSGLGEEGRETPTGSMTRPGSAGALPTRPVSLHAAEARRASSDDLLSTFEKNILSAVAQQELKHVGVRERASPSGAGLSLPGQPEGAAGSGRGSPAPAPLAALGGPEVEAESQEFGEISPRWLDGGEEGRHSGAGTARRLQTVAESHHEEEESKAEARQPVFALGLGEEPPATGYGRGVADLRPQSMASLAESESGWMDDGEGPEPESQRASAFVPLNGGSLNGPPSGGLGALGSLNSGALNSLNRPGGSLNSGGALNIGSLNR